MRWLATINRWRRIVMPARLRLTVLTAALLALGTPATARSAEPLPALGVDAAQTSVSGISSGAYMAGQFHVAFSTTVVGVGVVAGGPWGCASNGSGDTLLLGGFDNATRAFTGCMKVTGGEPNGAALAGAAADFAARRRIDPLSGLAGDRVYLFHGESDSVVAAPVAAAAEAFYRAAGITASDLHTIYTLPGGKAGHSLVVEENGSACSSNQSPFIDDCDYDQAGEILRWIYPDLVGRPEPARGRRIVFDQTEFLPGAVGWGVAREGVAYVPPACESMSGCRVHIVFHGCLQSRTTDGIDDLFIERTGYMRYADSNRLVLLYPQTNANTAPNSCWDWWGHAASDHLSRRAPQLSAVKAMLDRLAEPRTLSALASPL
jgi:poly(3-hydroxybutyrate) depolymerase